MVYCVRVGLEAHIGQQHSRNGTRIHSVGLGLPQGKTFPVQIGVQGIQDIGCQAAVKKEPQEVIAVMPGRLKSYFYAVLGRNAATDLFQKELKSLHAVGDGEHVCQHFPFRG